MGGARAASRLLAIYRPHAIWVGALLAIPVVWGCAGPLTEASGGFRHAGHGFWLARPERVVPAWEQVDVEGAVLAYRRPGPVWMSVQSRCGGPMAEPRVMARHLLLGIPRYTVRQSAPQVVGGESGWVQVFDAAQQGSVVRVKTVTAVTRRCALDFILSARADFDAAEPSFDAWWSSLAIDPDPGQQPARPEGDAP